MSKPLTTRSLMIASRDLAERDDHMRIIFELYGKPPLWDREPGFATLLRIILEQQVSLASAKACFDRLQASLGEILPERLLDLSDVDLRYIGFSRQKTAYARHLSEAVLERRIDLDSLHHFTDNEVKVELKKLKGVGEWTSDIYLLMALLRPDVMPKGDVALHSAYKKLTVAQKPPDSTEFLKIAEKWKPFRSVAARFLWHYYLSERTANKHRSKIVQNSTVAGKPD